MIVYYSASGAIFFHSNLVSFQVYIPIGTDASPAADAGNGFGDDRIIGINLYFKEFQGEIYPRNWIRELLT